MKNSKPEPQDIFDFERLTVYQKALELFELLTPTLQNPPQHGLPAFLRLLPKHPSTCTSPFTWTYT